MSGCDDWRRRGNHLSRRLPGSLPAREVGLPLRAEDAVRAKQGALKLVEEAIAIGSLHLDAGRLQQLLSRTDNTRAVAVLHPLVLLLREP
jgi:hypothetical protein